MTGRQPLWAVVSVPAAGLLLDAASAPQIGVLPEIGGRIFSVVDKTNNQALCVRKLGQNAPAEAVFQSLEKSGSQPSREARTSTSSMSSASSHLGGEG